MRDDINHPSHYNKGKTEVLEFIEQQDLKYSRANIIKYDARAGTKRFEVPEEIMELIPDESIEKLVKQILPTMNKKLELRDLKKARFYLNREIHLLECQINGTPVLTPNQLADRRTTESVKLTECYMMMGEMCATIKSYAVYCNTAVNDSTVPTADEAESQIFRSTEVVRRHARDE